MVALFGALWRRWGSSAVRAIRATLVLHIWVVLVPLLSALVARFYVARLPPLPRLLSPVWLVRETLLGMALVACILGLYMTLTHLVRYLRLLRLERRILAAQPAPAADAAAADEDLVFDLFDAPPGHGGAAAAGAAADAAPEEEGELDDLLGLAGPWHRLVSAAFYVVAFNAGVLALLLLVPNLLGLSALLLWHRDAPPPVRPHSELIQLAAGYAVAALGLLLAALLSSLLPAARHSQPLRAVRALLELLGVAVKVGALCAAEIGLFPLFTGTLVLRAVAPLCAAPLVVPPIPPSVAAAAARWAVGLAFMVAIGGAVRALRELLRPGALWFLRNPETAAVLRDMIELPLWRHVRRLAVSALFYALLVALQVALPALVLRHAWPLPGAVLSGAFSVALLQVDTYASRWYYAALIVLHLLSPYLLPVLRPAAAALFARTVRQVCSLAGLADFLLPAPADPQAPLAPAATVPRFALRLAALLGLGAACVSGTTLGAFGVLLLGKAVVRLVAPAWLAANDVPAFLLGLYALSAALHLALLVRRLAALPPLGRLLLSGVALGARLAAAAAAWGLVLPLLAGLALDRTLQPLRFRSGASAAHVAGHLWLLGFVWLKIWARVVLVSRPGRFRPALERTLNDGLAALSLRHLLTALVLPLAARLALFLALPYLLAAALLPLVTRRLLVQAAVVQLSHLALAALLLLAVAAQQARSWLGALHDELRNERYLVGAALHNYAAAADEGAPPARAPELPAN